MKRSTIARTFTIAALAALALGIAPAAKADDKGCSNLNLRGAFAYTSTGIIAAPAQVAGPFVEVGTQTFDGNGATTGTATLSQNGNIVQVSIVGTRNFARVASSEDAMPELAELVRISRLQEIRTSGFGSTEDGGSRDLEGEGSRSSRGPGGKRVEELAAGARKRKATQVGLDHAGLTKAPESRVELWTPKRATERRRQR